MMGGLAHAKPVIYLADSSFTIVPEKHRQIEKREAQIEKREAQTERRENKLYSVFCRIMYN